jgi:hypothetical protein
MKKMIEMTTNVAIIVVCGLLCWTVVAHKTLDLRALTGAGREGVPPHLKGHTLPQLAGYRWGSHPETLVLALRGDCHYCIDSMPFYRRLSDLEKKSLHAHLLVVMPNDPKSGAAALQSGGLTIDSVFDQPLEPIGVSGTPTLLLLDSDGRVTDAWGGQLTVQGENDVIAAVER